MGAIQDFFAVESASRGFDDIGFAENSGTISSVAAYGGSGRFAKNAVVTESAPHNLVRGQQVNITGTTDYDGPTMVMQIVSPTKYIIRKGFTVTKAGSRDGKAGDGNWCALMALGGDLLKANTTITYWNPNKQGGIAVPVDFTKDKLYKIPGGIKKIVIATAGNVRLFRDVVLRPTGIRNPEAHTIIATVPAAGTGAPVGASVDIIGDNFDPQYSSLEVKFNGVFAYPTRMTNHIITVPVPVGATTGTISVKKNGVNVVGPSFTVL